MAPALCRKISSFVVGNIEESFQRHGEYVAQHPWRYVIVVFLAVCATLLGFVRFRQERNPLRLWVPQDSDFAHDTQWLMDKYGEGLRMQFVLITAPDVLQPDVLDKLNDIHAKLHNIPGEGTMWKDICFKVPIISFNVEQPKRKSQKNANQSLTFDLDSTFDNVLNEHSRTGNLADTKIRDIQQMMTDETFDPSIFLGSSLYCNIVRNMQQGCLQQSLIDLWKFDSTQIRKLSKTDIIKKINSTIFSPTLGHPMDYKSLLGGVTHDEFGTVVAAKALLSIWMVHINFSTVDMDEVGNHGGTADWANGPGLEWESNFLKVMETEAKNIQGMEVYYEAGRSFGDISASGMFQDMDKLMLGIALMLIYVQIQQTEKSWVETRVVPSSVGLMCVGLSFIATLGLCSLLGIPYGPVHTSLPFLLLGIGVDDMFVILSCWSCLSEQERLLSLPRRIGLTMHHAGLSITITSATDVMAFAIGSMTILPSLQSFCLYAAMGVLLTYLLQASLFVAALVLDQRRMEAGRNCLIPCLVHSSPKTTHKKKASHCSYGLNKIYSRLILTSIGKVCVLLVTVGLLVFGVLGTLQLKQEFDPRWFLNQDSYLMKFLDKRQDYFPDFGNTAGVYLGHLNYNEELPKIGQLVEKLRNRTDILKDVGDWWSGFHRYTNAHFGKDIRTELLSDSEFREYIAKYLFSPSGSRYQKNFRFAVQPKCGEPVPNITVASFDFVFRQFKGPEEHIPAMNYVKNLVRGVNFTTGDRFGTVWAKVFANWVTDEVIAGELYRNLLLAIVCVGGTTAIFLADFVMSVMVLICVLFTLVDVCGFMHYWGLTIDLVSCIALVLAVGLCVDFAAHIGYAFLSSQGTRQYRALDSVVYIGGAVLHGGVTTLLALSVLCFSSSYIFKAFFKIFLLVILLGLFHGLVFLPVVLSVVGPPAYSYKANEDSGHDQDISSAPAATNTYNLEEKRRSLPNEETLDEPTP